MRKHKALMADETIGLVAQLGANLDLARKRRKLTIEAVCSRAGITAQTYRRLAKGEGGVTLAVLVAVLHALSLENDLLTVASPSTDEVGINLERINAPKRVRAGGQADERLDTDF